MRFDFGCDDSDILSQQLVLSHRRRVLEYIDGFFDEWFRDVPNDEL